MGSEVKDLGKYITGVRKSSIRSQKISLITAYQHRPCLSLSDLVCPLFVHLPSSSLLPFPSASNLHRPKALPLSFQLCPLIFPSLLIPNFSIKS